MAAFPTLTKPPVYPLDPDAEQIDTVLRSDFTAGYEQTRPKFTRARRQFGLRYRLEATDLATLRTFETTTLVNGADSFSWTHPLTAVTYTVRLVEPIRYARTSPAITEVSFTLREV